MLASGIVHTHKNAIDKMHEANATDAKAFYDACNRIILSLESQLRRESITEEARAEMNNQMPAAAKMIGDKGKENKEYWLPVFWQYSV